MAWRGPHRHIINGHVPVKVKKGESPVKGDGRLIVIDGGFCRAYQSTSGIAGYTLVYNSHGYRMIAHQPFAGKEKAVQENFDIASAADIFEWFEERQKIEDTDEGIRLGERISDLRELLEAYQAGVVAENIGNDQRRGL